VSKGIQNPNQKVFENISYPHKWKIMKLILVTLAFTALGIGIVVGTVAQINSKYKYLKSHLE